MTDRSTQSVRECVCVCLGIMYVCLIGGWLYIMGVLRVGRRNWGGRKKCNSKNTLVKWSVDQAGLPVCCLCTVWDCFCKQAKERTGRGATGGGGERANYCKVCVSGLGLEQDIFLAASASALEAAPTFNRHEGSLCHPFFFPFVRCLSFFLPLLAASPPPSHI